MRSQAIIIKKYPIREQDELIVAYTRDAGKQRFRAKSSLLPTSKQGPHLQVLNHIDFSLVEGNGWHGTTNYPIITSAYAMNAFGGLKSNLKGMATAYFFLECFDKLVFDNEPDQKLWEFLHGTLTHFNEVAKDQSTDWKNEMKQAYQAFVQVMGYHQDTQIHELHHTQFASLRFFNDMLQ